MIKHTATFTIAVIALLSALNPLVAQNRETFAKRIQIMGFGQVGYNALFDEQKASNTFSVNKIELFARASITQKWNMQAIVQFNSPVMLKEAFMEYAFIPELKVRLGQFKTALGLENTIPPFLNYLITGGSLPTIYFVGVAGDPRYHGTTGRDIGLELNGDLFGGVLSYQLSAMNGRGMNTLSAINPKLFGASLTVMPINTLRIKASYQGGNVNAMNKSGTYTRNRISVGAEWKGKPATILAEYLWGKDNNDSGQGALVTAAIHLPKRFDILLASDYTNTTTHNEVFTSTIGIQRWFFGTCRWQLEYQYRRPFGNSSLLDIHSAGHKLAAQLQFSF